VARLFIALNLPPEVRGDLVRAIGPLTESSLPIRWLPADNLHVTLSFLGEVGPEAQSGIRGALDEVGAAHGPITLELGGVGCFPDWRRARVIWLGADGGPELSELQRAVADAVRPWGVAEDPRPFHPHVTLGRTRGRVRGAALASLQPLSETVDYRACVGVGSVELMRSELSPRGARYHLEVSSPLARR
jgi:2'-5' RNA ligase